MIRRSRWRRSRSAREVGRASGLRHPPQPADAPALVPILNVEIPRRVERESVGRGEDTVLPTRRRHAEVRALVLVGVVAEVRDLRGGTLGFGMFGTASAYLIADLASDFRRKYPDVRLRLVGLNSSEVADQVRDATLEAGLAGGNLSFDGRRSLLKQWVDVSGPSLVALRVREALRP